MWYVLSGAGYTGVWNWIMGDLYMRSVPNGASTILVLREIVQGWIILSSEFVQWFAYTTRSSTAASTTRVVNPNVQRYIV
jgi:hypothetical protein